MKKKFNLTKNLFDSIVEKARSRSIEHGATGKKQIAMEAEFLIGAISALDSISGSKESCIPPILYFSIIRGDRVKKYSEL